MPLVAYVIGRILRLPLPELVGIVVVGACPGGTAANVMSYLSKANTALTVVLTFGTTLIAPLVTPTWIYLLLHKHISIPFWGIFNSMILIVFLPIVAGMLLKKIFWKKISPIAPIAKIFPVISIIAIALVVACVMALTHHRILSFPIHMILAVTLLNIAGYFIGALVSKLMRCKEQEQKSITFEYGMFDSGLGVIIATSFFGPLAVLAGALLSIIQCLTAPLLVKIYLNHRQLEVRTSRENRLS